MNAEIGENAAIKHLQISKFTRVESFLKDDDLSVEEPLEIRVSYIENDQKLHKNISVTMRTPGNDAELAAGFLFTEGIIHSAGQIKNIVRPIEGCSKNAENVISVSLNVNFQPNFMTTDRNFYTTSSCGVCGKSSIDSIKTQSHFKNNPRQNTSIKRDVFFDLPEKLRTFQQNFSKTGGIHACGLFDFQGNLLAVREDVGRHNALDKLIGQSLMNNVVPLQEHILLLSGRASFELIQKAAMAGITVVAAIGAPSSLAVELAAEFDITLIGFLRRDTFNAYHISGQFTFLDTNENQN
ncbi:formate dehydrogenase family accessory protein FdhD [Chryseobacterium sp. Leaf180]|uniref:formate dehydrogenase accessory sulfurtransferase FdhD n=1 Tax=Chryseobacterium sp. Leaf180 TaxID=1736289 RepID=UPI0006FD45C3|nr:formate dehydrogenase accessory sulfurtransferase FdhD [Chryseobacterium sp. Leaf180]KQR94809.1 formate dehydrogenase family accessory protein FdhD [Chryseobacterium sp. Leaf180]